MPKISLDAIHIIGTIKSTGSFSTAAEVLHKTPSAISYRVSNIESKLNIKLFHRNGPVVNLTKEGEFLLQEGGWILNAVNDLESRIKNMHLQDRGIRIILDTHFPLSTLGQDISVFISAYPEARIEIQRESFGRNWEDWNTNNNDLVVVIGHIPEGIQANTLILGWVHFVLCVSPNHHFTHNGGIITQRDRLKDIEIVMAENVQGQTGRNQGMAPLQNRILVSDLESQVSLIKQGIGHGFLPETMVSGELDKGELIALPVDLPRSDEVIRLIWHPASKGEYFTWWYQRFAQKAESLALLMRQQRSPDISGPPVE